MKPIAGLKRQGRNVIDGCNRVGQDVGKAKGNSPSPYCSNEEHGPLPENTRTRVNLHGNQAQKKSPIARIEADGQCCEGTRAELDAAGRGLPMYGEHNRQTGTNEKQTSSGPKAFRPSGWR